MPCGRQSGQTNVQQIVDLFEALAHFQEARPIELARLNQEEKKLRTLHQGQVDPVLVPPDRAWIPA